MKKDLFKKPLMISLAFCLAASVNVFGSSGGITGESVVAPGDKEIEGSSTVTQPVYNVVIPTNTSYNIAIDPFEKKEVGNQLHSEAMPIINKSDSAVKVTVEVAVSPDTTATTGSNKTLSYVAKNAVKQDDSSTTSASNYEIYAGLNPALDVVVNSNFNAIDKVNKNSTYEAAVAATDTSGTNKDAKLIFALDKATVTVNGSVTTVTALAGAGKGVAAYRFVGRINPYATWADDDLIPTAKYTIVGLSDANYRNQKFVPEGANLVDIKDADAAVTTSLPSLIGEGGTAIPTVTLANKADASFKLNFGEGAYAGDTIKAVYIDNTSILSPAGYMYTPADKILKIKKEAPFYNTFVSTPGEYKVIVIFNNGTKAVGHLEVTA